MVGVDRVLVGTDLGGISAAVLRAIGTRTPRDPPWPEVEFLDQDPITQTAADTVNAVRRMAEAGARVVVCLGGDGTVRAAAAACGDTPLLPLSTGTNNAFPQLREATVAGLAAGLVAVGAVDIAAVTRRAPVLRVDAAGRSELALVDVCTSVNRVRRRPSALGSGRADRAVLHVRRAGRDRPVQRRRRALPQPAR